MYAIVDIETTGGYTAEDRITEIAVILFDGRTIRDEFTTLVNPGCSIPPNISFLTGITDDMVKDAPDFSEIAEKVKGMLKGRVFVAHNVHFDLGFLRKSFNALGMDFRPRKLCTVRASRKIFPGLPSYGLDNLCRHHNIKIQGRHRAWGDAKATVSLLSKILKEDQRGLIPTMIDQPGSEQSLPPNLPKDRFKDLPNRTGVYFFHDRWGKIIYAGKARRIRDRVKQHFRGGSLKKVELKQNIRDISCRVTGNELIAELMESSSIRNHWPPFNKAQKFAGDNYGICSYHDQKGYLRIGINKLKNLRDPLMTFGHIGEARHFLHKLSEDHGLCLKLCNLQRLNGSCTDHEEGKCNGACVGKEDPLVYKQRVEEAINNIRKDRFETFMLVGKGREEGERAVVYVESGQYLGYTFVDERTSLNDIERIKTFMSRQEDNNDTRRIIRKYMHHPGDLTIIHPKKGAA